MARWLRSRLRVFGIGVAALLGGSLLVVPGISGAEEEPAAPRLVAAPPADRIVEIPGSRGRSTFEFQPASGDRGAPFAFVTANGTVHAQQLSEAHAAVQAKTGAPVRAAAAAPAAAATYRTTFTVKSENWSAWNKYLTLFNRTTWTWIKTNNPANSLNATANLPAGNYFVASMYGISGVNSYLLTKAFTVTTKAQTVVLDEASAKETAIRVDDATARRDNSAVWLSLPNGELIGFSGGSTERTFVTTASLAGLTLRVHELLVKKGSTALRSSPYRYDLVRSWVHPFPASPVATVRTSSLAKTTIAIRAQGVNTDGIYWTTPSLGESSGVGLSTRMRVPVTLTEYVTPGVTMSRSVLYGERQWLTLRERTLPAGTSPGVTAGSGPLAPSSEWYTGGSERQDNRLYITENMTLDDAAGNKGIDFGAATSMTLSSGGEVLQTSDAPSLSVEVPQFSQTYRLKQATTRKVAWSQLSTKVLSDWTFRSGGPYFGKLPLMDLAIVGSGLDQRNRAGTAPVRLTVTPSTRQESVTSTVERVEWSADDGATWTELPLTEVARGVEVSLAVPATAAFVSLRVTARNDQGGSLVRTMLRALAGPAAAPDEKVGATTITNLKINGGRPLVVGTPNPADSYLVVTATFTATDPSGIASAGLYLWHGGYHTPDGVLSAGTECKPVNATTSNCTASMYVYDMRYLLASNSLAGAWRAAVWASAQDGVGLIDRHSAGTLTFKRGTWLTVDATPEPVKKGKPITVVGTLARADWDAWTYRGFPAQMPALQFIKPGTTTWLTSKKVRSDANGKLRTTVTAGVDGAYRWYYPGDATHNAAASVADFIDVR